MSLGERLMKLRKEKHLSQEEVADRINVTRQTVSKWELDQSLPDFDKIMPICELYDITADELIKGTKKTSINQTVVESEDEKENQKKRASGLFTGILLYFIAVVWIMISVAAFHINSVFAAGIFLLICGFATCIIVYTQIAYKRKLTAEETKEKKMLKQIEDIVSISTLIIYLVISFVTSAWHITWLIWIVYALVIEIIKLIISLRGDKNENI